MGTERRCMIPADHPALAGHFPGNPVVPGVVILDEVLQALIDWKPGERPAVMPTVKFLALLYPQQVFTIRSTEAGHGRIRFECRRDDDGQLLVQGQWATV